MGTGANWPPGYRVPAVAQQQGDSMSSKTIAIVDFSAIFYRMWHGTGHLEVNEAHRKTVGQVLGYAAKHDHCVVALDSPPYTRCEIDPEYKGQRKKDTEMLKSQRLDAIEQLRRLGFYLLEKAGLEADDMIASAVAALAQDAARWQTEDPGVGYEITVYSADKDLLALHADAPCRVRVVSTATHEERTPQNVFGVGPKHIPHVLAMISDTSDNVPGIDGIGPKKAAALIAAIGDVLAIVRLATEKPHEVAAYLPKGMGDANAAAIIDAVKSGRLERSLQLVTLAVDPELVDVERVFAERQQDTSGDYMPPPDDVPDADFKEEPGEERPAPESADRPTPPPPNSKPKAAVAPPKKPREGHPMSWPIDVGLEEQGREERLALRPSSGAIMLAPDAGYLEPTTPNEAWRFCEMALSSRLFGAGNVASLMIRLTLGHSLGLPAMASLRGIYVFTDKRGETHICIAAQLLMAVVLQHPSCERLEIDDEATNAKEAWVIAKRKGCKERRIRYTIADAERARLLGKFNWQTNPEEMLGWRCVCKACRRVFADACFGIATKEEMEDVAYSHEELSK
jgi:5'-3' exonuclease